MIETANQCGLKTSQIVLELVESEIVKDQKLLLKIVHFYRGFGLTFAIDDFGSGFAGLNLLADFQPDFIKLDQHLIQFVHRDVDRQSILRAVLQTCNDLAIQVVAEGFENTEEFSWLRDQGVFLFQGFLFAKPCFEKLSEKFVIPSD